MQEFLDYCKKLKKRDIKTDGIQNQNLLAICILRVKKKH